MAYNKFFFFFFRRTAYNIENTFTMRDRKKIIIYNGNYNIIEKEICVYPLKLRVP